MDPRDAIAAELKRLDTAARKLEAEAEEIRAKLHHVETQRAGLKAYLSPNGDGASSKGRQLTLEQRVLETPIADAGIRRAITLVVGKHPGLRPTEIAGKMEFYGFRPSGKTRLAALVSSEAYHMAAKGRLKKEGRRYYPASVG